MLKLSTIIAAAGIVLISSGAALSANHSVSIKGMKFDPPALQVAAGDSVTFTNEDAAPHTATANDGSFDTGRLGRGESATVTISSPGTVAYICKIHPAMKGTVVAQ
jgi:plastocyanin